MIICISFIHHNFLHQLVFWFPGSDRDEVYKEIFEQAENFEKYQNRVGV